MNRVGPVALVHFFERTAGSQRFARGQIDGTHSILGKVVDCTVRRRVVSRGPISSIGFGRFACGPMRMRDSGMFSHSSARGLLGCLQYVVRPCSLTVRLSFCLFVHIKRAGTVH